MRKRMLQEKIDRAQSQRAVIVCCGKYGQSLLNMLCESGHRVDAFFDNSYAKQGTIVNEVPVEPFSNKGDGYVYYIANEQFVVRKRIIEQLISMGIDSNSIIEISSDDEWQYWEKLPQDQYKEEISRLYLEAFGTEMNWESPSRYSEIINFEKINASDIERKRVLSDKYRVREFVANHIGEEHLVKLLGVWDKAEEINFSLLPEKFVLKTNNASGRNILVKDKSTINEAEIREILNHWLSMDYGYSSLALHYKGILPKIICEEYLDGLAETVYDYDVFCFHGKPKYIWCISGSHRKYAKASFYDLEWNKIDNAYYGYPYDPDIAPKPKELQMILDFSAKLSKDFRHARVDWYIMPDGRVLFSEITFATWGGLKKLVPEEMDEEFGRLILEEE